MPEGRLHKRGKEKQHGLGIQPRGKPKPFNALPQPPETPPAGEALPREPLGHWSLGGNLGFATYLPGVRCGVKALTSRRLSFFTYNRDLGNELTDHGEG